MKYLIYETTNLINGKKYRGAHVSNELDDGYLVKVSKRRKQKAPKFKPGDDALLTDGYLDGTSVKVVSYNSTTKQYKVNYMIGHNRFTTYVLEDQIQKIGKFNFSL
jgi:transcription antitermination factor NusG